MINLLGFFGMQNNFKLLNLDSIRKATLYEEPYPYMTIDNLLQPDTITRIVNDFPAIERRGSFPLSALKYSGYFETLIKELERSELRDVISDRFELDLAEKATMITVRGVTNERDGKIHIDSKSKLITVLLYLNPNWEVSKEGCLRVLYNQQDLKHYAAEVPPIAGRCIIFKVTPNCWHGHEPFIGVRRSLQLNYVTSEEARESHLKRHRISAFFKNLFFKNDAYSTY